MNNLRPAHHDPDGDSKKRESLINQHEICKYSN